MNKHILCIIAPYVLYELPNANVLFVSKWIPYPRILCDIKVVEIEIFTDDKAKIVPLK